MRASVKIVLFACFLLASSSSFAQNVTNVDANQEGKAIAVTYDLKEQSNISIFISYDGGKTISEIPGEFLSGSVGKKVASGKGNKILWKVLDQYPNQNFQGENLSFVVKGNVCMRAFVMLNGGYSIDSGPNMGLSTGQFGKLGWYVKALTTFAIPRNSKYSCAQNGYIEDVFPIYSGMASKSKMYGVGGIIVRLGVPVYLNAGAGYGKRSVDWQTSDGQWVHNDSQSYKGLAIDAGLMTSINHICLSVGTTVLSGHVDVNLGVGYIF